MGVQKVLSASATRLAPTEAEAQNGESLCLEGKGRQPLPSDMAFRHMVLATRKDDIYLAEDSKKWIQSPERKASRKEKEYAVKRLDGLIRKIECRATFYK